MENASLTPAPPPIASLDWRPLYLNDLEAVVELARACYQSDGGLSFLFEPDYIQSCYFPAVPGNGIGAFLPDGRLAACTSVHLRGDPGQQRARIMGHVRPGLRGKGIGAYLMRWSQAQAQNLQLSGVMQIATECLTEPARRLYQAHGFQNVFEELVMARDLHTPLPDRPLPPDVSLTHWRSELAEQFFQAYQAAFQERPGFPGYSAAEWIAQVIEDHFPPEWCLLARVDGEPVGFVNADRVLTNDPPDGYIAQIGVVPAQRRRGLASALLVESMRRMQGEQLGAALLTVHLNNPGAIRAYTALGFIPIGRRARFERSG